MNKTIEKNKIESQQCGKCSAEFEIWLSNSRMSEDKKEKMANHLLAHCPACSRVDEG
jgi:DNA-directed RNA polymerase subunit RPC12/RpoP